MPRRETFDDALTAFAEELAANFRLPVQANPEDQLKAPVGVLLRSAGRLHGRDVNYRTEAHSEDGSRPDLGITIDGLLSGHIELKAPGIGAHPERFSGANRKQWNRFKALPNLIYTDGSEWALFRSGERVGQPVRIAADVTNTGGAGLTNINGLATLLQDFTSWSPITPTTAPALARLLAPLAKLLRDEVRSAAERGSEPILRLAREWKGLLFPEGDDESFADAYAQTLTYALLLAQFEGADTLRVASAADTLHTRHALLANALSLLAHRPVREELQMPLELLQRAIEAVDPGRIRGARDPWLYFYEDFLSEYDPKLRKDRGVYYTPTEVVKAQVTLVGELLQTRLAKPLGYAENEVTVLDPAVGTGTYPLAVIDHAVNAVTDRFGPGAVADRMTALSERLYAFELLVGPYAVAHLRLAQRFRDTGARLRTEDAVRVFLTDTLESPFTQPEFRAALLQERLSEEHRRAQVVKRDTRVLVCIGNPPYDREQHDLEEAPLRRKGAWVRYGDTGDDAILEDFLRPVREAGEGEHLKNLYNDYVYFWRWALWKVFETTEDAGIVSFITASSYLRGKAFAGMRRRMRETFDDLWIIDLEGDSLGARKTDNVFAIRTPVAIAIGVRDGRPNPAMPARVWKTKITGTSAEKLQRLDTVRTLGDLEWAECITSWDAPFYPAGQGNYMNWPAITDLFPWQHSGVQMKRTWPIGESPRVLQRRIEAFVAMTAGQRRAAFRETRDRKIERRYQSLLDQSVRQPPLSGVTGSADFPAPARLAYRTFDRQWVIPDSRLGDFMRPEIWRAHSEQQIYFTGLLTKVLGSGPGVIATADPPDMDCFCGRGAKDVIPLWRDRDCIAPNVTDGLLQRLSEGVGRTVTAEELFCYVYAVLSNSGFTATFWTELELPPPRVPVTTDDALFSEVARLGNDLVFAHTFGERDPLRAVEGRARTRGGAARCIQSLEQGEQVTDFAYNSDDAVLHVGSAKFAPVPHAVWEFSVSGLSVLSSWLGYRTVERAGRRSSILDDIRPEEWTFSEELLEVIWAIERTIAAEPVGAQLLHRVLASRLLSYLELPSPTEAERQAPGATAATDLVQGELFED